MGISLAGRLGALALASFALHTALLVNSAETEVWREQSQAGALLSQQVADAAAPLALSRDMVSLSVLTARFEQRPAIASLRVYDNHDALIGQVGNSTAEGRHFLSPMALQGQALGRVDLQLSAPQRGDILHRSLGNIGLSALAHAILLLVALGLGRRSAPIRTPAPRPEPAAPLKDNSQAATTPAMAEPVALLHLTLDDPNHLLMKVNASTADELLTVLDHLLDRAARLYGGEVTAPFSPSGTVVVFRQGDATERAFQALVCGQLFLHLTAGADLQRRDAGLFSLPVKAGVHHAALDDSDNRQIAAMLAVTAPSGRLLSSTAELDPAALARCQPGQRLNLALGAGRELPITVIERLLPEYQQLIHNQTQQLLGLNQ